MKLMNLEIVALADSLDNEKILSIVSSHSCIDDFFFVLHDNDIRNPISHYHIYLRFKSPQKTDTVCDWFGVPHTFWYRFHGSLDDFKDIKRIVKGVKI